jgi:hypothetical protein
MEIQSITNTADRVEIRFTLNDRKYVGRVQYGYVDTFLVPGNPAALLSQPPGGYIPGFHVRLKPEIEELLLKAAKT